MEFFPVALLIIQIIINLLPQISLFPIKKLIRLRAYLYAKDIEHINYYIENNNPVTNVTILKNHQCYYAQISVSKNVLIEL